jgi:hypothetical protein
MMTLMSQSKQVIQKGNHKKVPSLKDQGGTQIQLAQIYQMLIPEIKRTT